MRATHTANLAQGKGFRALKAEYPKARVSSAFNMSACEPATDSADDKLATARAHAFRNVWFLEPALKGRYPDAFPIFPSYLMGIRSGDMEQVRVPLDFIGINIYDRTIVSAPSMSERLFNPQYWFLPAKMNRGSAPTKTDLGWEVWPKCMYDIVTRITRDYNRPVIEITENGAAYGDGPGPDGLIHDSRRISYVRDHLAMLARAIRDGADVRGYHHWSLLDNFEWDQGYSQRLGFVYMDYKTQKRTMKDSGKWYAEVAKENALA